MEAAEGLDCGSRLCETVGLRGKDANGNELWVLHRRYGQDCSLGHTSSGGLEWWVGWSGATRERFQLDQQG